MQSKELQTGRAGEFLTVFELLIRGKQAYLTDQGVNYDVVFEHNNQLIRLQVKTTAGLRKLHGKQKNKIYHFHLKRCGKLGKKIYGKNEFEGFALVILDKKHVCFIKNDENIPQNSVSLRDKETKYIGSASNGKFNGLYYQDLTLDSFLENISCERDGKTYSLDQIKK